jgi:diamine N-acetyltransferase
MTEPESLTPASTVSLREVNAETVRAICALSDTLSAAQRKMVADNAISIAQAYFTPEAWFRAIYAGDTPVGFVMLYIPSDNEVEHPEYYLWRFMIAGPYQKLGYGQRALELIEAHVRTLGAKELLLSCCEGDASPEGFYRKAGYERDGKMYDEEVGMRKQLH